jgi:hypothetical protein
VDGLSVGGSLGLEARSLNLCRLVVRVAADADAAAAAAAAARAAQATALVHLCARAAAKQDEIFLPRRQSVTRSPPVRVRSECEYTTYS